LGTKKSTVKSVNDAKNKGVIQTSPAKIEGAQPNVGQVSKTAASGKEEDTINQPNAGLTSPRFWGTWTWASLRSVWRTVVKCLKWIRIMPNETCEEKLARLEKNIAPWWPRFWLAFFVQILTFLPIGLLTYVSGKAILEKPDASYIFAYWALMGGAVTIWIVIVGLSFWYTRTMR
jgi:hypothetical protein